MKPRLRHNYVMYSLHLFAQIYMLTTDCAWGPLITDPPTAQSRAISGKRTPNETMKIMNSRWWWIVRAEVWNAAAFGLFFFLDFSCCVFFEVSSFYHKPKKPFVLSVRKKKKKVSEWVWRGSLRGLSAWLCAKSIECSVSPHADAMYFFLKMLDWCVPHFHSIAFRTVQGWCFLV